MNKIDELIHELCPNGVEYKKISEVYTRLKGTKITAGYMAEISNEDGEIKIFAGGKTQVNAKLEDIKNSNIINEPAVLVQSRGLIDFIYYDKPFTFKNEMWAYKGNDFIETKYLYYLLKNKIGYFRNIASNMGSMPQISLGITEDFKIPIPPLDVQKAIVKVLDTFTELTAELTAELALRKKQYSYYRDHLLNKENMKGVVEMKKLGDVCKFVRGPFGGALKKEIFKEDGFAVYEQQHAIYQKLDFRYFVDEKKYKELERFQVKTGDLIVSCSGTIGKTFIIPDNNPEGIINQALLKLTPTKDIDVVYLQYYFENTLQSIFNDISRGGAIKNLPSVSNLKKLEITVPSLEEQKRIVEILDRFNTLTNDLQNGLPAEIEARKKQYEYYRNKLLSF